VLRGEEAAALYGSAPEKKAKRSKKSRESPSAVDEATPLDAEGRALFEKLRALRRRIAAENNVPTFMVFSDKSLRAMARRRPTTKSAMLLVHGVGPVKIESFGERFLEAIRSG
jgi:ATP-dependent DNA helicase RecQ